MGKLAGKTALVTGAGRGIGKGIARALAREGADMLITSRTLEQLQETAAEVEQLGVRVIIEPGDIGSESDVERIFARFCDEFDRLDLLVNNAGIYGPKGPIETTNWDDWVHAINVNLLGSVLMCRAVVPLMKNQGYGKIIQLSGGGATNPMPNLSSYAVAKAGVVRFIETLALEVAKHNVDVNAIAPGALNTRMLEEVIDSGPEKIGVFSKKGRCLS